MDKKSFQRSNEYGGGVGDTSTLPAYMRTSHQIYATTNRNAGPKLLPQESQPPSRGSQLQSPITTQSMDGGVMLANAASGSISEKSAFDSYVPQTYHHHMTNSIDYQYNRYQQHHQHPSREEGGGGGGGGAAGAGAYAVAG